MRLKTNLPTEALGPLTEAAEALGCAPAILAAILHRESGHLSGAARLAARRFEPHVFRRLGGGLAATHAGAAKLDPELAEQASSHGAPQIMGHHAKMLGYASASAMRAAFLAGGWPEQMQAMRLYAERTGLASPLRALNMPEIARIWNGPAYARAGYDLKLTADHARISGASPTRALRLGDQGEEVSRLQRALSAAGHPVAPDGVFGPRTEAALRAFQQARGLSPDGLAGALTQAALESSGFLEPPEESAPSRLDVEADRLVRHRGKLLALLGTLLALREDFAFWSARLGLDPDFLSGLWTRLSAAPLERWALAALGVALLWPRLAPFARRLPERL
ncbi:N-acetylmuramidase domain-containing protein [Neomegalonema sp.]|uniref:N-acetylmuramidase domain-containing protein n=1 Tax=Neomegalonema sp. TaxID=2039713 RepID=UPI002604BD9C|nr:N-acetylmuramidase domain-containing protein [Neomegalonema sp.]MDD2869110.1 N-acetylmuramidase domain-containing protein [Neomegalonema sp.]